MLVLKTKTLAPIFEAGLQNIVTVIAVAALSSALEIAGEDTGATGTCRHCNM
jgi:hypothetical protein